MNSPEQKILQEAERLHGKLQRPVVVALDGGSGAGKSTISERLRQLADVVLVSQDDFYQTRIPESQWLCKTVAERLEGAFDWERIRTEAIEPLRQGRPARWRAFDFMRGLSPEGTYRLKEEAVEAGPAAIVLVEGAYSASPYLRDLVDLAVLVDVPVEERHLRIAARETDGRWLAGWHAIWDEVEKHYFQRVCPPESFDLVVRNEDPG